MPRKFKHDTLWLKDQYLNNLRTAVDIAQEMGVTSGAVYDMLRRRGIQRRDNSKAQSLLSKYPKLHDKEYLMGAYANKTTQEIAWELGCHDEAVRKALKRFNIPRRSVGSRPEIALLRDKEWLIKHYLELDMCQLHIAQTLGCGETVVNKWIKKHQIHKESRWSRNDYHETKSNRSSTEYKHWRARVLKKDNYTCQECGATTMLHAHHIKSFAHHKQLRYNDVNGRTLCRSCHKKQHYSLWLTAKSKIGLNGEHP